MEKQLEESVLDFRQPTKEENIWDIPENDPGKKDPQMRPEVHDFIMKVLSDYRDNAPAKFNYTELFMIGGSTTFNYSPTSDIDINATIDVSYKDLGSYSALVPRGILVPGTQHPVNVFLQSKDDVSMPQNYQNIYNLLTSHWDKITEIEISDIPYAYITEVADFYITGVSAEIARYGMDSNKLKRLMAMPIDGVSITERERDQRISEDIRALQSDIDSLLFAHSLMWRAENNLFKNNDRDFRLSIEYRGQNHWTEVITLVYKICDHYVFPGTNSGLFEHIVELSKEGKKLIEDADAFIAKNTSPVNSPEGKQKQQSQEAIEDSPKTVPSAAPSNAAVAESDETVVEFATDDDKVLQEAAIWMSLPDTDYDEEILEDFDFNDADPDDKPANMKNKLIGKKIEGKVNAKIAAKSKGAGSMAAAMVFGGLLAGIPGMIGGALFGKDDFKSGHGRLQSDVRNDSEAYGIIGEIKSELAKKDPDKKHLKELKLELMRRISIIKKNEKKDDAGGAGRVKIV